VAGVYSDYVPAGSGRMLSRRLYDGISCSGDHQLHYDDSLYIRNARQFFKLVIPAAAEIVFTVIQMSHVPADPSWQRILLGISLCCVFFAANFVFVLYEVKNDLNHLH
jgi:hypothetical protein